jgi:hypothetical protein
MIRPHYSDDLEDLFHIVELIAGYVLTENQFNFIFDEIYWKRKKERVKK